MFKKSILSLAVASSVVLTGCLDNGETGHNANPDYRIENPDFTGKTWPIFNPATSALPVPNDLIFDQTAKDGTFAVTGDMTNPAIAALNSLSGASTSAPIDIRFSGHIDPASVDARAFLLKDQNDPTQGVIPNPNQNVFLIALDYASGDPVQGLSNRESPTIPLAVTAAMAAAGDPASGAALVQKAMSPDYEATVKQFSGDSFVRIQPLKPLNPRTRYVVVLTNGIKDMNGDAIVPSPAYANITDPNQGLGSNALAAVRNLMNGLWEPLATGYFALNNGVRTQLGLPALTDKNIALSYSFTTSNDEKVLRYIAEPSAWFNDQLTGFLRVSATKAIADAQTDLNQDGKVDYSDMKLAADGAVAGFPNDAIKAALGPVFAAPPPAGCQSLTGAVAIGCVSKALTAQFGPAISAAKARVTAIDSIRDATQVSAILSQFAQPGEVRVAEGTVDLPYYLGMPSGSVGTPLVSQPWQADDALASALNQAFAPLGLSIPHANPATTTAVNYVFPFPKKVADVKAPMLVIYPANAELNNGNIPVVIFQHGITTDRSAALTFGTALAKAANVAVVAIDQPLHGVGAFTAEKQRELATSLLQAGGQEVTDEKVNAIIAGQFSVGALLQIDAACPTIEITNPGDAAQIAAAKGTVLGGGCGPTAAATLGGALVLEGTVANAGSIIPGLAPTDHERHFNFTANAASQPVPMDFAQGFGSSGSLFINLGNFLKSRDNVRQGSVDLMNLRHSVASIDLDGNGTPDLSGSNVFFVGHSLGTITGSPFVAVVNQTETAADNIRAANFITPGSGIVRLLENSPSFAPRILGGLQASANLVQGDANLESFFNVLQATLDAGDPINFADNLVAGNTPTLFSIVLGDAVIPNSAYPNPNFGNASATPLAGSEPMATLTKATNVVGDTVLGFGVTRYTAGSHGTPVLPKEATDEATNLAKAVFGEMVGEVAAMVGLTLATGTPATTIATPGGQLVVKKDY